MIMGKTDSRIDHGNVVFMTGGLVGAEIIFTQFLQYFPAVFLTDSGSVIDDP